MKRKSSSSYKDPIREFIRMREVRQFFHDKCSGNSFFEHYRFLSFSVAFRFACDFLHDIDLISDDLHFDLTTSASFDFRDSCFIVYCNRLPCLKFHFTCTYSNIVIQIINQLNINLK